MSVTFSRALRLTTLGTAIVGVASLTACPDDEVIRVAPQIFVDVCAAPAPPADRPEIGGFQDCALAFGEADISVRTERFFTITNPSGLKLNIDSIELSGDVAFEFINEPPTAINPGLSAQLGVTIRPSLESTITGEIVIISDANNTPKNDDLKSEIRIPVTLTGVDNGVPDIELIPQGCGGTDPLGVDFGRQAAGGVAICNVEVRNNGSRDLFFDNVGFVDAVNEPADSDAIPAISVTGTVPDSETPLAPTTAENQPLILRLTFAPDALGAYSAVLRFETNDPDEPSVDLPIIGQGVVGPTCVASVKAVNNVPVDGNPSIEPLDDVLITSENSTPSTPDGSIAATSWTFDFRGPDSTVVFSDPNSQDTGFLFANRRGVDVAGPYRACAVVTDELGIQSNNECCVEFEAIPEDAFLVQLTWLNPTGDMDLHVTKKDTQDRYCVQSLGSGGGNVDPPFTECTSLDCYFGNCKQTGGGIEWDGVPGRGEGDPSLDIDDLSGFGPENINVDAVSSGSYGFGASVFSGSGAFTMTMRLFLFGRLSGEWQDDITADFWEVGLVHFPEEDPLSPCIEDVTDGDFSDECPGF